MTILTLTKERTLETKIRRDVTHFLNLKNKTFHISIYEIEIVSFVYSNSRTMLNKRRKKSKHEKFLMVLEKKLILFFMSSLRFAQITQQNHKKSIQPSKVNPISRVVKLFEP